MSYTVKVPVQAHLISKNSSQKLGVWLIYWNIWGWSSRRPNKYSDKTNNHIKNWKHIDVDHCLFHQCVHLQFLLSKCSLKLFIFTLLKQLNTNLQGNSIRPQSCYSSCCISFFPRVEQISIYLWILGGWMADCFTRNAQASKLGYQALVHIVSITFKFQLYGAFQYWW